MTVMTGGSLSTMTISSTVAILAETWVPADELPGVVVAVIVILVAIYAIRLPQEKRSRVMMLLASLLMLMTVLLLFVSQGD